MELVSSDIRELLTGLAAGAAHSAGRLVLILIAGFVLARVLRTLLVQLERVLIRAGERAGSVAAVTRARVSTLTGVLRTLAHVAMCSVVAVICLWIVFWYWRRSGAEKFNYDAEAGVVRLKDERPIVVKAEVPPPGGAGAEGQKK